jgi:hypothetical protein
MTDPEFPCHRATKSIMAVDFHRLRHQRSQYFLRKRKRNRHHPLKPRDNGKRMALEQSKHAKTMSAYPPLRNAVFQLHKFQKTVEGFPIKYSFPPHEI